MNEEIKEKYLLSNGWKFVKDGLRVPHHIINEDCDEETWWDRESLMQELTPMSFWQNDEYEGIGYEDIDEALEYEIEDVQGASMEDEQKVMELLKQGGHI